MQGTGNLPAMDAGQLVQLLGSLYQRTVQQGLPVGAAPSVMLWGAPGVGKSQAVRQVAERLEAATGLRAVTTDVRLLLFSPVDLRGIPTANSDKTLAVWLKPKVFEMDPSPGVANILLLDEISAAPPSVQAAAYQIVLDRAVGEHRLPANCAVIAAGNRTTDRSVAHRMPKALANRLMHIEVRPSFDSWRTWASSFGLNPKVRGFLEFDPSRLMAFDPESDALAFPTPRSWEMASNVLDTFDGDVEAAFPLLCATIGTPCAQELRSWNSACGELPSMDDIFSGKPAGVPRSAAPLHALVQAIAAQARERWQDDGALANSMAYARRLPPDFSALLLREYLAVADGAEERLAKVAGFAEWTQALGEVLNGSLR